MECSKQKNINIEMLAKEVMKHIVDSLRDANVSDNEKDVLAVMERNVKSEMYADQLHHMLKLYRHVTRTYFKLKFGKLMDEYSKEDIEKFFAIATKVLMP